MEIEILQENLTKAVSQVARAIDSTPQLPILANIYLKAQSTGLLLSGTNLETTVFVNLPAKTIKAGEATVSARRLSELVATITAGKMRLTLEKEWLTLAFKSGEAKFPTMPPQEYPVRELPKLDPRKRASIGAGKLIEAIKKTVFAAATDETRPVLSGGMFEMGKKKLVMVATDGYRLSKVEMEKGTGGEVGKVVIPAMALREIEKNLDTEEEVVINMQVDKGQVFFNQAGYTLGTRMIEGEFPSFEKIIPEKGIARVVLEKEDAIDKLRAAAIFARDNANIVHLEVKKEGVVLAAKTTQVGEGKFNLESHKAEGGDLKIAFNYRFLLEALGVFGSEQVVMEFSGSLAPVKLFSPGEPGFIHIIMPVRLQG